MAQLLQLVWLQLTDTHGFEKGDIITYELPSGATPIAGLVSGRQYKICNPVTANTFGLTNVENTPDNNPTDSNIIAFGEAYKIYWFRC